MISLIDKLDELTTGKLTVINLEARLISTNVSTISFSTTTSGAFCRPKTVAPAASLNVQDILYVLFKHKWKILLCAAIGIGAAATVFLRYPSFTNPKPNCSCATWWTQVLLIRSIPEDSERESNQI